MPTPNQLIKSARLKKNKKKINKSLQGCPQKRGICLKLTVVTPKKPNSALRKIARILLSNRIKAVAYIPGKGGHNLLPHSAILVRGGRTKDVVGLRYKAVRGKYDLKAVPNRTKSRSKYGIKSFRI